MELGVVNPGVPLVIDLELQDKKIVSESTNSHTHTHAHTTHPIVSQEDTVGVFMLAGYFVVGKKICKLLNKVQNLQVHKNTPRLQHTMSCRCGAWNSQHTGVL